MSDLPIPASTTTSGSEGRGGGGHDLKLLAENLKARGVQASLPSLLQAASAQAIARTIDWWDGLSGAGPGVLVDAIRKGGVIEQPEPKSMLEQQRIYGQQIAAWLTQNFPELDRPHWGPHPAAVAAVIRLHHQHGKGRLTKREHGPEIRAAVKAWQKKWETDDPPSPTKPQEVQNA